LQITDLITTLQIAIETEAVDLDNQKDKGVMEVRFLNQLSYNCDNMLLAIENFTKHWSETLR
jgi:hypothetical protein